MYTKNNIYNIMYSFAYKQTIYNINYIICVYMYKYNILYDHGCGINEGPATRRQAGIYWYNTTYNNII